MESCRQFARGETESAKTTEGVRSDVMQRPQSGGLFWWECDDLWLRAAELAVDDACLDRAQQLVVQLRKRVTATQTQSRVSFPFARHELLLRLRSVVLRMDDEARLAEFDQWVQGMRERAVERMRVRWTEPRAFVPRDVADQGRHPPQRGTASRLGAQVNFPRGRRGRAHVPGDRLQFSVAVQPIDPQHFVAGDRLRAVGRNGKAHRQDVPSCRDEGQRMVGASGQGVLGYLQRLPQPQTGKALSILDAAYVAGRLYLATSQCGLLAFDTKTEKWSIFGPEQGLPDECVAAIYPLDERTLFCVGRRQYSRRAHYPTPDELKNKLVRDLLRRNLPVCYTLELPEGKVTLRHRASEALADFGPDLFWRDGKKLMAWGQNGLYDDLLGQELKFSDRKCGAPYGWSESDGRTFSDEFRRTGRSGGTAIRDLQRPP